MIMHQYLQYSIHKGKKYTYQTVKQKEQSKLHLMSNGTQEVCTEFGENNALFSTFDEIRRSVRVSRPRST